MDTWKFFAATHARHVICNPLSGNKVDEIIDVLALYDGARLLDIACGKGEFLRRAARRWGCAAVGVDISPFFVADARKNIQAAKLQDSIEIVECDAAQYAPQPASFDASVCLGASWIWNGFEGTLRSLSAFTKPGGLVVSGEPFWKKPPSAEYLEAIKTPAETYGTHAGNVETGAGLGLQCLHAIVSSDDDWDRYEGYQWYAAEQYARQNAGDPDAAEILARVRADRENYLRWGRDEMGWAVYLFLNAGGIDDRHTA